MIVNVWSVEHNNAGAPSPIALRGFGLGFPQLMISTSSSLDSLMQADDTEEELEEEEEEEEELEGEGSLARVVDRVDGL